MTEVQETRAAIAKLQTALDTLQSIAPKAPGLRLALSGYLSPKMLCGALKRAHQHLDRLEGDAP